MPFPTKRPFYRKHTYIGYPPAPKHDYTPIHYFQVLCPIHQPLLLGSFASEKRYPERFPLFVQMSEQRYRSDRAIRLHQLIGHNFKTLREQKGVSIKQVAEATAISTYRLRKLDAGTLRITPTLLLSVCDYFNVLIECMVREDLSRDQ